MTTSAEDAVRRYLAWIDDPDTAVDASAIEAAEAAFASASDPIAKLHAAAARDHAAAAGANLVGQATTRSINAIFSFESYLPFDNLPHWRALRALPLDEQQRRLRDPGIRR